MKTVELDGLKYKIGLRGRPFVWMHGDWVLSGGDHKELIRRIKHLIAIEELKQNRDREHRFFDSLADKIAYENKLNEEI